MGKQWSTYETKKKKNLQTINAEEGVEKREPSYSVAGNVNWCSHYGEQYEKESRSVVSNSLGPHGILQARILEWVAFPFSRGSSQPSQPSQSVPRERT